MSLDCARLLDGGADDIAAECICNGFAELSRFADRQFYEDFWNSTSQDEFARKWNRCVPRHFLHLCKS